MEQLAVITGTFNPLTKAHISMGLLAGKKLGGDSRIVYVPSRHDFLTGWKEMPDKDILSEKNRLSLLETVLPHYGFTLETCETDGTVTGYTYDTLCYLCEKYRISRENCYYVCGSDKLPELYRWKYAEAFLSEFSFLVFRRNEDDLQALLASSPLVSDYASHFTPLGAILHMEEVSATRIRAAIPDLAGYDWNSYAETLLQLPH